MHVTIETKGESTRGMTVCDLRPFKANRPEVDIEREWLFDPMPKGQDPNVEVALELDQAAFDRTLLAVLEEYGQA